MTKDERKIMIRDKNIHKAMKIPVHINETNNKFTVIDQPKNACKLESADHLWLPNLDLLQSNIVVFQYIFLRYITLLYQNGNME